MTVAPRARATATPPTAKRRAAKPPTPPVAQDDPATAYAKAVVAGSLPAGPYVRDACARHIRDLEHGPARGLVWDVSRGDRVVSFFKDVLRLNGGDFEGKPFILLPWQEFCLRSVFGWLRDDGFRRFRMAFVLTAKGSGKSPAAAGVGLYCLLADREPRAEVYAAASKRDQAAILFRDAAAMVHLSPELSKRVQMSGGPGKEWNIAHLASGSFFRTIASENGQSGPRPHCSLLDEIHEHKDNTVVEMLRAGTKGRKQALIFAITNAESDRTGVCAEYRAYAAKVCSGALEDDSFFAYVAALDETDDPFVDESCWAKANPSLGHTFGMSYLREQVTAARGMPSKEAIVRRLNFCQPTDAASPWVDSDLWTACEADFDPDDLKGLPCFAGLDLSAKRDLTALAVCWKHPDGRMSLATWAWTPADTLDERARTDSVPYPAWVARGFLNAPAGRMIDKEHVARFLKDIAAQHDLQAVAYDNAMADDFVAACDNIGLDVWIQDADKKNGSGLKLIRHGQGFAGYNSETVLWMPRSIGNFEDAIVKNNITIRISPVLRWNSASAVLQSDPAGNRKWEKRKSTGRIDCIVAATMAVGAANVVLAAPSKSIWDDEETWKELKVW